MYPHRCKDSQKRSFLRTYALAVHDHAYDYATRKAMFDIAVRQCGPPPQQAADMIARAQLAPGGVDHQEFMGGGGGGGGGGGMRERGGGGGDHDRYLGGGPAQALHDQALHQQLQQLQGRLPSPGSAAAAAAQQADQLAALSHLLSTRDELAQHQLLAQLTPQQQQQLLMLHQQQQHMMMQDEDAAIDDGGVGDDDGSGMDMPNGVGQGGSRLVPLSGGKRSSPYMDDGYDQAEGDTPPPPPAPLQRAAPAGGGKPPSGLPPRGLPTPPLLMGAAKQGPMENGGGGVGMGGLAPPLPLQLGDSGGPLIDPDEALAAVRRLAALQGPGTELSLAALSGLPPPPPPQAGGADAGPSRSTGKMSLPGVAGGGTSGLDPGLGPIIAQLAAAAPPGSAAHEALVAALTNSAGGGASNPQLAMLSNLLQNSLESQGHNTPVALAALLRQGASGGGPGDGDGDDASPSLLLRALQLPGAGPAGLRLVHGGPADDDFSGPGPGPGPGRGGGRPGALALGPLGLAGLGLGGTLRDDGGAGAGGGGGGDVDADELGAVEALALAARRGNAGGPRHSVGTGAPRMSVPGLPGGRFPNAGGPGGSGRLSLPGLPGAAGPGLGDLISLRQGGGNGAGLPRMSANGPPGPVLDLHPPSSLRAGGAGPAGASSGAPPPALLAGLDQDKELLQQLQQLQQQRLPVPRGPLDEGTVIDSDGPLAAAAAAAMAAAAAANAPLSLPMQLPMLKPDPHAASAGRPPLPKPLGPAGPNLSHQGPRGSHGTDMSASAPGRAVSSGTGAAAPGAAGRVAATLDAVTVLNNPALRRQVRWLPAEVFAALLGSPALGSEGTEDSVLVVAADWLAANAASATTAEEGAGAAAAAESGRRAGVTREQLSLVCSTIRLAALSGFYLSAVMPWLLLLDESSGSSSGGAGGLAKGGEVKAMVEGAGGSDSAAEQAAVAAEPAANAASPNGAEGANADRAAADVEGEAGEAVAGAKQDAGPKPAAALKVEDAPMEDAAPGDAGCKEQAQPDKPEDGGGKDDSTAEAAKATSPAASPTAGAAANGADADKSAGCTAASTPSTTTISNNSPGAPGPGAAEPQAAAAAASPGTALAAAAGTSGAVTTSGWFPMRPEELAFLSNYARAGQAERAHVALLARSVYDTTSPWYTTRPRMPGPAGADGSLCFEWHISRQTLVDALARARSAEGGATPVPAAAAAAAVGGSGALAEAVFAIRDAEGGDGEGGDGGPRETVFLMNSVVCRGVEWRLSLDVSPGGAATGGAAGSGAAGASLTRGSNKGAVMYLECAPPAVLQQAAAAVASSCASGAADGSPPAVRTRAGPGFGGLGLGVVCGKGIQVTVHGWRGGLLEEVVGWSFMSDEYFVPGMRVPFPSMLPLRNVPPRRGGTMDVAAELSALTSGSGAGGAAAGGFNAEESVAAFGEYMHEGGLSGTLRFMRPHGV